MMPWAHAPGRAFNRDVILIQKTSATKKQALRLAALFVNLLSYGGTLLKLHTDKAIISKKGEKRKPFSRPFINFIGRITPR
jgi:hypothetical protein